MSAADELLAWLETTTVKFDIGRGGIPQLTPQDVAAALGMCSDKFAVTIYLAARGGSIDIKSVDAAIAAAQFDEWRNRADRMINAQIMMAQAALAPPHERAERRMDADMKLSGAKAAMWPHLVESIYSAMRLALLAELRSNRTCPVCHGRSWVKVKDSHDGKPHTAFADCENCLGSGRIPITDRQRAAMLNINESSYRRTWRPVYEWMYRMLNNAIADGHRAFSTALDRVSQ
jgi:hypothetical protein